jgi:hypothetical protein
LIPYQPKKGEFDMAKQDEAKSTRLARLQQQIDQEFAQAVTTQTVEGSHLQHLSSTAVSLGFEVYIGSVAYVGRTSIGKYGVQFNAGRVAYASYWPQWAFDLAKSALLYGKKLRVMADGEPLGQNLLAVTIDVL